jgi:hypothetical protein
MVATVVSKESKLRIICAKDTAPFMCGSVQVHVWFCSNHVWFHSNLCVVLFKFIAMKCCPKKDFSERDTNVNTIRY